ncbi:MAG: methyltransferase, partial [Woeseiaceae bacterium]|nr:methyltransferase [Woeseiaceae bacterium]
MNQAIQMIYGKEQTQLIFVAASLGVADLLKDGPMSIETLAAATDTHTPSLYRVMRALVSHSVVAEPEPRQFALTPSAEPLQTDHPRSIRNYALMHGSERFFRPYANMLSSVKAGGSAFEHTYSSNLYDHAREHPEDAGVFDAGMTDLAKSDASTILDHYDFSRVRTVADIGGGAGLLLARILKTHQSLSGTLFDLPHSAQAALELMVAEGLHDRCEVIGGDFFASLPTGIDLFLLKAVLMDWEDEQAIRILQNCRDGINVGGRVLVMQTLIPDDIIHGSYP